MPRELSEAMKESIEKFECLSNGDQFKDHIADLFNLTAQEISKTASGLKDRYNPSIVYDERDLVFRTRLVELRDQVIRPTNNELNKINGDGRRVPEVEYVLLETEPENWSTTYTAYYMLKVVDNEVKYVAVPDRSPDPAPEFALDTYYKKETS